MVKQLAQMIPHAVFDEIPDAGHLALFERPGEWRRLVTKYLSFRAKSAPSFLYKLIKFKKNQIEMNIVARLNDFSRSECICCELTEATKQICHKDMR